jgi:hypothetical protein
MPTGAKLSERGFGNHFWIATAGRRGDLNDFFCDDVYDRIIAINKIERAQRKRVRLVQPLDLIRFKHAFRKKAIDRHGVSPTCLDAEKPTLIFDNIRALICRFGGHGVW